MARCVPGASLERRDEDGNYVGSIVVSFGPKRIVFRGKATAENDPVALQGSLTGQGTADMRAARFKVRVTYALRADPTTQRTIVALRSEADLQGVIADFARTGGNAVAKVFMDEFSRRIAEDFSRESAADARSDEPQSLSYTPAVSGFLLLRKIITDMLRRGWAMAVNSVSIRNRP
jgi:carbon monoxide dehydrogenase subunit G